MMQAGVQHEQVNALLGRYAAGDLDESEALMVREHLASGCEHCLNLVFQPHGNGAALHTAAVGNGGPVAMDGASVAPRVSRRVTALLGVLAILFAATTAWMYGRLAVRARAERQDVEQRAARVAELDRVYSELDRMRSDLEKRAAASTAARAAAEEEAKRQTDEAQRQAEAARASADAGAELARRLESAEARVAQLARGVRRRDAEINRLLAGMEVRALGELAATPGVQVLRLVPGPGAGDGRGHVLWHPARDRIMLYVFDLPSARYRVRLWFEGAIVLPGPELRLGRQGEAAAAIELSASAARLRAVEVIREPDRDRVLAGRLETAG